MKIDKEIIVVIILLIVITVILTFNLHEKQTIEEENHTLNIFNEKIPLYYNIDYPDVIYTRNESGEFELIK